MTVHAFNPNTWVGRDRRIVGDSWLPIFLQGEIVEVLSPITLNPNPFSQSLSLNLELGQQPGHFSYPLVSPPPTVVELQMNKFTAGF